MSDFMQAMYCEACQILRPCRCGDGWTKRKPRTKKTKLRARVIMKKRRNALRELAKG